MRTEQQIKSKIDLEEIEWFGRDKFINKISNYLLEENDSKHICLKGTWGSGKTTTILGIMNQLQKEDVLTLYLDAWKYENYEHPTFALLKAIEKSNPNVYNNIKNKMKEKNLSFQTGLNLPFFSATLDTSINDHRIISEAEYISEFNDVLIEAIKQFKTEQDNKLIIFVDELDRAKPEFALRLLETFHHLYDELPTHFVYSVDINQLNSMIKHYYGYEYNTEIFLHKVFDEIIPLAPLEKKEMERYLAEKIDVGNYNISRIMELISYHIDSKQKESLRSMNYILNLINQNINNGYFKLFDSSFGSPDYYLGKNINLLWGYVELLIILITTSLSEPLYIQDLLEGRQCDRLADYLIERNHASYTRGLDTLIFNAYNYDSASKDEQNIAKEFLRVEYKEKIIIGLVNIFIPPKTLYYEKSVFSDIIL